MRVAHKTPQIKADLFKPITLDMVKITEEDCFGQEWEPSTKECSECSDCEVCGVVFQKVVKKPKQEVLEKKQGPYLDEVRFLTTEEKEKVVQIIHDTHDAQQPTTTEEMFEYFKKKMKTKDDQLVLMELKKFIKETPDVYTKGGFFYHKLVLPF